MRAAFVAISVLSAFALLSCSNNTAPEPATPVNVSTDPAIGDTSLELVIVPGLLYEDIKTERLEQDFCDVDRGTNLPGILERSLSGCSKTFNEAVGRIRGNAVAAVVPDRLCLAFLFTAPTAAICALPPPYRETTTSRTSLIREFEVAQEGADEVALNGSISFDITWLGRIVSAGVSSFAAYEIAFIVRDMDDRVEVFKETISENTIQGKLNTITVKGVPIPVPTPQWSIDRVDDETFARPIILKTGRRYRIQLRLILTARSAFEPGWISKSWFSNDNDPVPNSFLDGFNEDGFLQWTDITIKLNADA